MEKEKAIDLTQKVLAKTRNNTDQHEVELAMLKAQELMIKHNLIMEDIEEVKQDKEVVRNNITEQGKTSWWTKQLANVIGENFRCQALLYRNNGKSNMVYIGLKDDVNIAIKVFKFALECLVMQSDRYVNILRVKNRNYERYTTEKNNYILGFITGIKEKYCEQVEHNDWGLMLVKDEAVISFLANIKTSKDYAGVKFDYDESHFENGLKDGKNFEHKDNLIKN